jgi:universal stress protein A
MEKISKILVPLDFSEASARALRYAVDLANRYDATLELVHVFDVAAHGLPDPMLLDPKQFETAINMLHEELAAAKRAAAAGGIELVDTALLHGKPAAEILKRAQEGSFDLIVLGTHGRSGLKHLLIGSVAELIVRSAPCPVLAVKAQAAAVAPQPQA